MEKLVLIDGNSLLNRAFYATPVFTTKSGMPTNAVFGFVKLMLRIISDKTPGYFAVAFDLHAPTFRHKMYADYKAGRKPMPDELAVQIPVLKDVLRLMNIKILEKEGFEADDLLGTVAKKFDVQTYIYTGDRDAYQLVDKTTNVCFTRKGVSDILELNNENFFQEVQLDPYQIVHLKALMGDKSDHIPGVAGVGEKSALSLLERFKTLDGIYEHIDEVGGALQQKLINGKADAYFSYGLATINTNVPIELSLADCLLTMPFPYALREKFAELEFKSLNSMNIFKEEETNNSNIEKEKIGEITEVYPTDIAEFLQEIKVIDKTHVVCNIQANETRIAFFNKDFSRADDIKEYVLPIRENLLDTGFFEYQVYPVFKEIFNGNKRVVGYHIKDLMHTLSGMEITFNASYDDVSILKCLSEGLSNSDSLIFCLNQQSLPEKNHAVGLAYLYGYYHSLLNEEEKRLYNDVELPLVRVLFDMEMQGVCVNYSVLSELSAKYTAELSQLTKRVYELAGEEFNINSTQQLGRILFDKLRIGNGTKKSKDSKSYKTTAEELEKYADTSEIVRYLLRYRKVQKLNSTYLEGFKPLIINGKVHTTYNQINTATGRLSSANPNIQNIPVRTEEGRELRKLFTASEGNVLIDADYSQIELRLLAHFSGCKELITAYCEGKDIHAITASQVFNVPLEKVSSQLRREAKAVNFGIIYGISAFGLSNDLNINAKKAQTYIEKYFETYSDVKTYMNKNVETAKQDGYIKTLLSRKRVINELHSSNRNVRAFGERAAMNMPLQGSSADIIKIAMINVHKRLKNEGYQAKLVMQVHDELLIDCPKAEEQAVSKILKEEMENAVQLLVPLTVEVGVGQNWYETK